MKHIKYIVFKILILAGLNLAVVLPAKAVSVNFQTLSKDVTLGSSVSMELQLLNPDYQTLAYFDIEVAFNSTLLGFNGLTFGDTINGDQLNQDGLASQEVFGPYDLASPSFNAVNIIEIASSVPAITLDEYLLATLSFSTIAAGNADLWINVNALSDDSSVPLDLIYAGIGKINVTAPPIETVPETSTLLLMVIGLAGLTGFRKLIITVGTHQAIICRRQNEYK